MTPQDYYSNLLSSSQILPDDQQLTVVEQLQRIYKEYLSNSSKTLLQRKTKSIKGLYSWGDVGVGKTFLMDILFYCLPGDKKKRFHFHKFMKETHEKLRQFQGKTNPLRRIAQDLAKNTNLICFDELVVTEIVDAMILSELFQALYQEGICIIFTSNTSPQDLYKNGLQRQRFLPAIKLIEEHAEIIYMTNHQDYRLSGSSAHPFYLYPSDEAKLTLEHLFNELTDSQLSSKNPIMINGRLIPIIKEANGVLWIDFKVIVGKPCCQLDYLVLAESYHTIIISNLVAIRPDQHDTIRTFINLIDVLYDAKIKLIISADVPLEEIYLCGKMMFEFARTKSRLTEMRTLEWHQKCSAS